MGYTTPIFNVPFDFWRDPNAPPDPPDYSAIMLQLYVNSKNTGLESTAASLAYLPPIYLRMSWDDYLIIGYPFVNGLFMYDDGLGNQNYYLCNWWEVTHLGFANQYLTLRVLQCDSSRTVPDPSR